MKKIFISRDLQPDSIFLQQLETSNFQVHGESLLEFAPVPFKHGPATDWLFFYSQRGVHFFFDQYEKIRTSDEFHYKCAAIGPATAAVLKHHLGVEPYFTGTGFPQKTSELFYEIAAGDHVCFVQARNSKKSVQDMLLGKLQDMSLVVYDNDFKAHFSIPHSDILIL